MFRSVGSGSGHLHVWPLPLKQGAEPISVCNLSQRNLPPSITAPKSGALICSLRQDLHSLSPSPITECVLSTVHSDRRGHGPLGIKPPSPIVPGVKQEAQEAWLTLPRSLTCPPPFCCCGPKPAIVMAAPCGSSSCVVKALYVSSQLYTNQRNRR